MQISKTQIKWILAYGVAMFLSNQFVESYFRGLSPFNQIFLLTELHSKILLKSTISETSEINSVAISADGQTIVSRSSKDNTIKAWNLKTGKLLSTIAGNADKPGTLLISPDWQTVVSSDKDGIKIWDLKTGSLRTTFPNPKNDDINSVVFSRDGQTLLTENDVESWNLKTGELKTSPASGVSIYASATSRDGQTLVNAYNGSLLIWDLKTGKYKAALVNPDDQEYVNSVAISPDGQTIVSGNRNSDNKPDSIKTWQMP